MNYDRSIFYSILPILPIIITSHKQNSQPTRMQASNNFYTIKSKHSGKVLDVCQDADTKGMLIIYDLYGGPNQHFYLKPNGVLSINCFKTVGEILNDRSQLSQKRSPRILIAFNGIGGAAVSIAGGNSGSTSTLSIRSVGKCWTVARPANPMEQKWSSGSSMARITKSGSWRRYDGWVC